MCVSARDSGSHTNYRLMLTHFSDIDSQGHCCGVLPEHNEDDTYEKAIATKAEHLKQMLEAMEPDTVAIIIADHGHVDVGGHGGVDPVLRDIPLYVCVSRSMWQCHVPGRPPRWVRGGGVVP